MGRGVASNRVLPYEAEMVKTKMANVQVGQWLITTTKDERGGDLVAQQVGIDGPTGPTYSLITTTPSEAQASNTGPTGSQGYTGPAGDTGDIGPTGPMPDMTGYVLSIELESLVNGYIKNEGLTASTGSTGPTGPSGINGTRLFIVTSEDTSTEAINTAIYSKYGATASVWDSVILTTQAEFYELL
jgi:hypothetical protein